MRAGDSTTREHVATVNGVVDAISDRPADGTDGAKDRDCLARRGSDGLPALELATRLQRQAGHILQGVGRC